jgi:cytochrome b6-f complex iron-sulfur subunit
MTFHRRGMFRVIFGTVFAFGLGGLAGIGAIWAAAIARFLTPNVINQPPQTFIAGKPSDYTAGNVETRFCETRGVCIVCQPRAGRSRIVALRAACTHLGCITLWHESEQRFRCPCHGSAFTKDGINVEGPAPRPLERCAIRLTEAGHLEIDTAQTFRQDRGQWNNASSYVEA